MADEQPGRIVEVHVEMLAVDRGLWCGPCAKSTGAAVTFVQHCADGEMRAGQIRKCRECGAPVSGG